MGFTLREVLGGTMPSQARPEPAPLVECPTGKVGFQARAAADAALRRINRNHAEPMHRFRCGFCGQFHLGHRRGVS